MATAPINYAKLNTFSNFAKPDETQFNNYRSGAATNAPLTDAYGTPYSKALDVYNTWSTDPEAVAYRTTQNSTKYAPVVNADGTPLFDPTFYNGLATGTVKQEQVDTQLNTWADSILTKDPNTNWSLSGGAVDSNPTYAAAKKNLLNNLANNPNFVNYNTSQAAAKKEAEDKAISDAKAIEDAKIAKETADAKVAAEVKAIADQKIIDDKAAADAKTSATAADTASIAAQNTAITNASGNITPKDTGLTLDAQGNPVVKTANITQGMIADATKGTPTNVKYDVNGKPIITTPTYTTVDTGMLGKVTADKVNPVTVDRTGTQSAADIAKLVDAAKSVDVNVTPDSLVSNRLSGLLAKNNPYIQQAVNAANLQASRRGMLNTGAAAGFATDAAINKALPIAQADAATIAKANEANAAAANQLLTTGLDLKSKGLISDTGNNVTLNTTQAKLNLDASQYDASNKLTADTFNAQELNKILTTNNATLNEAQKDAFTMWGQMAQADTLSQSNVYRTVVQAQYDALKQGAADANALAQTFATGNINLGIAMRKSLVDAAATERKAAIDKAAASQLATDQAAAAKALAEETRITKIADAEIAKVAAKQTADINLTLETFKNDKATLSDARSFMAQQEKDKNNYANTVMNSADIKAAAKADNINAYNLKTDAATLQTLQAWGVQKLLSTSDAGKTATALLNA
jgi:hypothetical protein